jgi:serine/threonine-protein kinase
VGLTILRKICDGLHAAHTAVDAEGKPLELVHRDVKAENVLISRSGAVKVGDFGIAKANQQVHKTQLGELKGTAAYMAPEHRTGQAVDKRADIYGVGAIAYEVITGNEVNLDLAMLAHLGREGWPHLPPLVSVRPDLPPELDAVVFKALQYEKDARYPTCEAFEEALEAVASRHGLNASDKQVAQWVESVIAHAPRGAGSSTSAPGAAGGAA